MMTTADLKSWLLSPAFLLALVPLVKLGVETLFRRVLGNSTLESLHRAAAAEKDLVKAARDAIRGANDNAGRSIREGLACYLDNRAALEKFFETCFFTVLSLAVWWPTEQHKLEYQKAINIALLVFIALTLVIVGVRVSQDKYEYARIKAVKNPSRVAFGINLLVVILESASKLTGP